MLKKDRGTTKELNSSSDCAQAAGTVSRHSAVAQEMLMELNLKQVLRRPPAPPPICDSLTLPGLTVTHKYFNSNALHLEIKGLIQVLL